MFRLRLPSGWTGLNTLGLLLVGRNEERGWALAGAIVPVAYVAWSAWLVALGVVIAL